MQHDAAPADQTWQVCVPLPIAALDFLPPHGTSLSQVPLGCRVVVPWRGGEVQVGLVVGAGNGAGRHRLREALALLDPPDLPWVPPATVRGMSGWAHEAHLPPGLVWDDLLGTGWELSHVHEVRAVAGADLAPYGDTLPGADWSRADLYPPLLLDAVREQGLLDERFSPVVPQVSRIEARALDDVPPAARTQVMVAARPWQNADPEVRSPLHWEAVTGETALTAKQAQAHDWLRSHGPVPGLNAWASGSGVGLAVVRKVAEAGWARETPRAVPPPPAWTWLHEHGPVSSPAAWAAAAGVRPAEVRRLMEGGGADYTFVPVPPPPAWTWLREHGPAETLSAWASGAGVRPSAVSGLLAKGWAVQAQGPAPAPELPAAPLWNGPPLDDLTPLTADPLPEERHWRLHGGRPASRFATLAPRVARLLSQGRGVLVVAPDHASLRRAWAGLGGLAELAGTRAALLSGQLSPRQREETWRQIRAGEVRLVVGSALALTAPLPDLGLLLVLEEGSDAHKLLSGSRAFVPDVAARVAQSWGAALGVVGSVPAVESVPLPGLVLPPPRARVHVVDYAKPPEQPELGPLSSVHLTPGDLGYPISHDLARLLRQVQERGRQAALLAPRRGYSALLRCPRCDHVPGCPNCDVPLRFHQDTRQLACHQCGHRQSVPDRCDQCGEQMWKARGPGTEWIAAEVQKLLPGFPVYRLDKDRQDDLTPLHAGEAGVVVGTQLLLSQPCPPNLALIGVTLADTWLGVSDFRASERYHRLLRQLAEWHPARAPLLLVQTFQGEHPALRVLETGRDALAYPAAEERVRAELFYPPHARLAQIEVAARDRERARVAAQTLADALHGAGATAAEVLGPAPAAVARVRGAYVYQLLLRARNDARLSALLAVLDTRTWGARLRVDVNPRST